MLASELRFLIPSESLPRSLRFCPSVFFLPNGISIALVEVTLPDTAQLFNDSKDDCA